MIFFISGHLDLTPEEFTNHYSKVLYDGVKNGHTFVVGDANGADAMSQKFLSGLKASVTVYHMFTAPRNNYGFKTIGGFKSDNERDSAMTKDSNCDIVWIRPGRENSGTAKNVLRRLKECSLQVIEWSGIKTL